MPSAEVELPERLCETCGYNLRGLVENRCPECGTAFNPRHRRGARIPWLARQAIGSWRSYWQTVAMVMLHPLKLGREIWEAELVDPKSSARFRRIVVLECIACVPVFILAVFLTRGKLFLFREFLGDTVLWMGGLAIFLIVATDASISLQDPNEQAWLRALRDYACAPLAAFPAFGLIGYAGMFSNVAWAFVSIPALLLLLISWWITHVLVMRPSDKSNAETMGRIIVTPLWWALSAILAMMLVSVVFHLVVQLGS